MQDQLILQPAIKDIVHDYSTLVLTGDGIPKGIPEPWNGPVEQSFHTSCRKFACFFLDPKSAKPDDILAKHYLDKPVSFDLPLWKKWWKHHNTHLFHLSYKRVENTRPWTGYQENPIFFHELRLAWRMFLGTPPRYADEFERQIQAREKAFAEYPYLNFR